MDFTKLPTDNFYIFLSLAGIVLLAYFIGLFFKVRNSLANTDSEIKKEIEKRRIALAYYKSKLKTIKSLTILKSKIFQKEFDVSVSDFVSENPENLEIPATLTTPEQYQKFITRYEEIRDLLLNTEKEIFELEQNVAMLEIETNMRTEKDKERKLLNRVTYVFVCMGIFLSLSGFSLWFFKHQFYQDKLLEFNYEMNKLQNRKLLFEDSVRQVKKIAPASTKLIDSIPK